MGITGHKHLTNSYEKLGKKYSFLLDRLNIINITINQKEVNIAELQKIVSNTIDEVTRKFPM